MPDLEMTLEQMIDLAVEHAKNVLIGRADAQITPCFLLESRTGARMLFSTPWRSDIEKQIMTRALGATMRERDILRYSFISEAWMATMPRGDLTLEDLDKKRFADEEMPRNRSDRIEVVMIMAADKARRLSHVYRIIRGEGGTVVKLDRDQDLIAENFIGRFANLLQASERER